MPDQGQSHWIPLSREEKFLAGLDKAIEFNRTNTNDPHGIGNAVLASLFTVREAFAVAYGLPTLSKAATSTTGA